MYVAPQQACAPQDMCPARRVRVTDPRRTSRRHARGDMGRSPLEVRDIRTHTRLDPVRRDAAKPVRRGETDMAWRSTSMRTAPAVLVGVSVAVIVAGCASSPHSTSHSARTTPLAKSNPAAASTAAPASSTEAGAQNLLANSALRTALLAAYATEKGLPQDDVTGPLAGSLYYGRPAPNSSASPAPARGRHLSDGAGAGHISRGDDLPGPGLRRLLARSSTMTSRRAQLAR
jgi:hypothetical protein